MPKVKNYFLVNTYCHSKKGRVMPHFFKLETFNCRVSFYWLTLTNFIIVLRDKVLLLTLIQIDWISETYQDC